MSDIAAFLTARLDEDETLAREASAFYDGEDGKGANWIGHEGVDLNGHVRFWIAPHLGCVNDPASGRHINRHDPARVLREVAAKRAILARHWDGHGCPVCLIEIDLQQDSEGNGHEHPVMQWIGPCETLRNMAAPYADHPDYDAAWSE